MRAVRLGFACNNACVFCAQGELRRALPARRDVEAQLAAIEAGEVVAFTGGEPMLHEELFAWLGAAAARRPARLVVQTNGRRLAYLAYARALGAAAPGIALDVSLHGSTGAMHDYHTGAPGSFAQTVLGLRHAREVGLPFGITTVVTRSSFRHLPEIARLAHACGARAIHFAPAEPVGRAAAAADRLVPAEAMVAPHLARAAEEAGRLGLGFRSPLARARSPSGEGASGAEGSPGEGAWGELFAGLGEVEEGGARGALDEAMGTGTGRPRRLPLASLGRPAPATREERGTARRTGEQLSALFPALFPGRAGDG